MSESLGLSTPCNFTDPSCKYRPLFKCRSRTRLPSTNIAEDKDDDDEDDDDEEEDEEEEEAEDEEDGEEPLPPLLRMMGPPQSRDSLSTTK